MVLSRILADDPDYRITLHQLGETPAPRLIVSFGGQPSDLSDAGFATTLALENGCDNIFVAQRLGTQYQGLSLERFWDVVAPHCNRDVVTYGSSLGAYCAVYYGGCIDARIVAAAPMLPAWRPLGLTRYADLELTHVPLDQTPTSRHDPIIIYDPKRPPDLMLVEQMIDPVYPNARKVIVPYGGHTVLRTLSELRCLKPLVLGIIEHDHIIDFPRPDASHATWHLEIARETMRHDRARAIDHLQHSIRIRPSKQAYNMLLSALVRARRTDEAQQILDQGRATQDRMMSPVPSVHHALVAAGLSL